MNVCDFEGKKAASCIAQGITDHSLQEALRRADFKTPPELHEFLAKVAKLEEGDRTEGRIDRRYNNRAGRKMRQPTLSRNPNKSNDACKEIEDVGLLRVGI